MILWKLKIWFIKSIWSGEDKWHDKLYFIKKKIKNKINIAQIFQYFEFSGFFLLFFFFFFVIFPYFPLIFNLELIY